MKRIDAVLVTLIVTEYDAQGVAIGERSLPHGKVFLGDLVRIAQQIAEVNRRLAAEPAKAAASEEDKG